jgi:hypothetical protein
MSSTLTLDYKNKTRKLVDTRKKSMPIKVESKIAELREKIKLKPYIDTHCAPVYQYPFVNYSPRYFSNGDI